MPLGEIYTKLLSMGHVAPLLYSPLKSHFPNWYKPNLTYEFHTKNLSHNIDTCSTFKRKLLQLFKAR